jgi:hypothetical protein
VKERVGEAVNVVTPKIVTGASARCNTGELATGGGYIFRSSGAPGTPPLVILGRASGAETGWDILVVNIDSTPNSIQVFVQCASLAP